MKNFTFCGILKPKSPVEFPVGDSIESPYWFTVCVIDIKLELHSYRVANLCLVWPYMAYLRALAERAMSYTASYLSYAATQPASCCLKYSVVRPLSSFPLSPY